MKSDNFNTMSIPQGEPTELELRATKQWLEDGSVPQEYVDQRLGDVTQSVSAQAETNKRNGGE